MLAAESVSALQIVFFIAAFIWGLVVLAAIWKILDDAGEPGWACIVPIYNGMALCAAGNLSKWLGLLFLVPYANYAMSIAVWWRISSSYGRGPVFSFFAAILPMFFAPIIAFSKDTA